MGYFQVRYDSRVINYDRRGFIRLTTGVQNSKLFGFRTSFTKHAKLFRYRKNLSVARYLSTAAARFK